VRRLWFAIAGVPYNAGAVVLFAVVFVFLGLYARGKTLDERAADRRVRFLVIGADFVIGGFSLQLGVDSPLVGFLVLAAATLWTVWWLPSSRRALAIETSVVIKRDPATVFSFVANDVNQPRYVSMVESVEMMTTGPIGPGTRSRARVRVGGNKIWEGIGEIIDYQPNSRFTARVISDRPNLEVVTFELAAGGTLLRHRFESETKYDNALLGGVLFFPLQKQQLLAMRNAAWARLKEILESSEFDS
jgi:uncharacterized protein YndB with AHSA1/START domain